MGTREFVKSGLWFAVAGAIPGLCFIFMTWAQDPYPAGQTPAYIYKLWVLAPAVIAGAAGMIVGVDILDRTEVSSPRRAARVGMRVACISFVLYIPIMAVVTWVADGRPSPLLLLTWLLLYLIFGSLFAGWLILSVGAAAGWLLYRTRPDAEGAAVDETISVERDL